MKTFESPGLSPEGVLPLESVHSFEIEKLENWQPETQMERTAVEISRQVNQFAREKNWIEDDEVALLAVGGYPRDILIALYKGEAIPSSPDIDLATPLSYEQMAELIREFGWRDLTAEMYGDSSKETGEKSPEERALIHRVLVPVSGEKQDWTEYEIACFRTEAEYDGHQPGEVQHTKSMSEDMGRRDLTINALAMDLTSGEIYDCVGAIKDIREGVLRPVGDPKQRFIQEDPARIIRYVRFLTKYNLGFSREVQQAVRENPQVLKKISRARLFAEVQKIMKGPRFAHAVSHFYRLGIENQIIPPEIFSQGDFAFPEEYRAMLESLRILETTEIEQSMQNLSEEIVDQEEFDPQKEKTILRWSVWLKGLDRQSSPSELAEKSEDLTRYFETDSHFREELAFFLQESERVQYPQDWKISDYEELRQICRQKHFSFSGLLSLGLVLKVSQSEQPAEDMHSFVDQMTVWSERENLLKQAELAPFRGSDLKGVIEPGPQFGKILKGMNEKRDGFLRDIDWNNLPTREKLFQECFSA